jgi:hypothetical protein|tara:strand:- start:1619 stop:1918 length:300 start_codon:yes stop_codon:yes gene_type:complete
VRNFIYKSIIILICVILIYEFTIGKQIATFKDKADSIISKEGRRESVNKLRDEINKAINKDRYLSKEDAILLNKFIKKIQAELKDSDGKELNETKTQED